MSSTTDLTSSIESASTVKFGLDLYFWMTDERSVLPAHSINTYRTKDRFEQSHKAFSPQRFFYTLSYLICMVAALFSNKCSASESTWEIVPVVDQQTGAEPSLVPSDPRIAPDKHTFVGLYEDSCEDTKSLPSVMLLSYMLFILYNNLIIRKMQMYLQSVGAEYRPDVDWDCVEVSFHFF